MSVKGYVSYMYYTTEIDFMQLKSKEYRKMEIYYH